MIRREDDVLVVVLPPFLVEEPVVEEDARLGGINSEGYTSRIYQCCQ